MFKDWRTGGDSLELNFTNDVTINDELNICTSVVGCPEHPRDSLSAFCVAGMNVEQLMVYALDVRGHAAELTRIECSYICRKLAYVSIMQRG